MRVPLPLVVEFRVHLVVNVNRPSKKVVGSLEAWWQTFFDLAIALFALAIAWDSAFPSLEPLRIVAAIAMEVEPGVLSKPSKRSILLLNDRLGFRCSQFWIVKMNTDSHGFLLGESHYDRREGDANLVGRLNLLGEIDGEGVAIDRCHLHLIDWDNWIGTRKIAINAVPPVAFVLFVRRRTRIDWVVARFAILKPSPRCIILPE